MANPIEQTSGLVTKINRYIWECNSKTFPLWKRFLIQSLRILQAILRDLSDGQISLRAMSLVYTTVISLVPLLAISFSVLKGFGAHNEIKPMLLSALEPLGEKGAEIAEKIIQFVDNIQVGVLGALGLALLIYSVISMMQKIERSFNYTWHVSKGRTFSQRFSDYLSVLLVGPLLIFLSVGITASVGSNAAVEYLSSLPAMGHVIEVIGLIIPYFIMGAAFAFIYFFMPNTKVNIGSAFIGGIVTAVIWKFMGIAFSAFVANSANQTAIYSAFASIIVFMVWLYLGWLVLLVGASIAFYHQNPNNLLIRQDHVILSNRVKEKLGLIISYLIGKNFQSNKPSWTLDGLATKLNMPTRAVEKEIDLLKQAGFLIKSQDKPVSYYPSKPLDQIYVNDIITAIRQADEHNSLGLKKIHSESKVDKFIEKTEKAVNDKVGKVTLKDIL